MGKGQSNRHGNRFDGGRRGPARKKTSQAGEKPTCLAALSAGTPGRLLTAIVLVVHHPSAMNKTTWGLAALSLSMFAAGLLAAAPAAKSAAPAPAPEKQQKLVRVSTLRTVEANREFQANVQLLQAQRQKLIELNAEHEKEVKPSRKKELKEQLDALLAKLNDNNDKMRKAYGFSLDRNYTLVVETAHVYMFVTEEEAARIAEAEKAEQAKAAAPKK
jgi:Spy/CpxP family protein refolding chaperone